MVDRYNPLVHEVHATVRMGTHPAGEYVKASDFDAAMKRIAQLEAALRDKSVALDKADTDNERLEAALLDVLPLVLCSTQQQEEAFLRAVSLVPLPTYCPTHGAPESSPPKKKATHERREG